MTGFVACHKRKRDRKEGMGVRERKEGRETYHKPKKFRYRKKTEKERDKYIYI